MCVFVCVCRPAVAILTVTGQWIDKLRDQLLAPEMAADHGGWVILVVGGELEAGDVVKLPIELDIEGQQPEENRWRCLHVLKVKGTPTST